MYKRNALNVYAGKISLKGQRKKKKRTRIYTNDDVRCRGFERVVEFLVFRVFFRRWTARKLLIETINVDQKRGFVWSTNGPSENRRVHKCRILRDRFW